MVGPCENVDLQVSQVGAGQCIRRPRRVPGHQGRGCVVRLCPRNRKHLGTEGNALLFPTEPCIPFLLLKILGISMEGLQHTLGLHSGCTKIK